MPPPPQQSHIPGGTIPALPPVLAPLDPQNFTHPPPPLPYSYATLLLHAFIISAILLAVPFLAYWMFLRVRKWRSGRLRHPQNQGRGWDEERNSAVDGVRGGGGGGSGGGRGGNIVETMRNVLWGSLRGLTNAGARRGVDGGWRARGSYNTLPLPGMQVKRVEVKRGRTLQQAESRSRWREVSCSRVGEYGNGRRRDDNYNAENRYGNAGVVGRRRTVSGPFGYGVGSGWGRSVQSTGQEVQRVRANIENRGAGGEYGSVSTASSDVASMGTVRKRSVGIPVVGIDVSPPPTMSENCQPQHTTDISDFFNMWDDIPLRETGNSRAVSGSFEDKVKAGYGTRVFSGPVKKENLNTKHIRQQHNEGSRNDELVNADQGRPKRQHWWKGWMRENKRGILTVEEDRLGGLYGSRSGVTKPKIDIPLGVVPPVGSPRRVGNADGCGGNSNDIRFYMRGARNDASFDGGPGVAGDGIGESPSEDKITTSEGDSNSLEWRWGRGRARYDGGEDSSENCEDLRYARFIAASQSSEWTGEGSSTGQGFGESLTAGETDTSTGTIVSASDSNTDTATTLEVLPGDAVGDGTPERDSPLPLAVWVNECERVDDADITAISGQRSGPSSSEASGSETPRPPQSAAALNTDRASAYFSSPASPDSTPSTPSLIPQTRGLKYQSPRPITPPTGTPSIRYHISRPTGHLFLQKVFEPHIKQYGNLLLPPLSRILYEKWRQHSIPLDQKEPSLEEGWHLGLGDGRRERDRWLRLRSGRYEGQRVDGLLSRGIKRRCSDPGVRRCIGKMWTQAVDLVRAVEEEEGGVKKVVRLKRDEALIGQRAMGMMYFPEWFSPGWESEEEEIFRFLHDDGEDGEEETSDQDVNVVLKHVAREKRRELTELLREFSEEMFLKEVDTRLEWWWWQTRGAAAGLAGREAERRRDILLLREGRTGVDSSVEMEKEYYDDRFPGEVQEGMRWEGWRWETDVPEGVRDLGAYCFPKPPQGAGTRYLGRRASVDGSSAVKVDARRWGDSIQT
ncbi:hypothetical protein EV426DRAFT_700164 [Tirmania nivea]|nr:hypothetical protein EV426DRAFT_700164 [Tirmania nivea]